MEFNSSEMYTKKRLTALAKNILADKIDLLEGAREIYSLSFGFSDRYNEALVPFMAICSETDQYPLGKARNNCAKEYLQEIDAEIDEYLKETRPIIRDACEKIIRIYTNPSEKRLHVLAKEMLADKVHLLEGVREMYSLRFAVDSPNDDMFMLMKAIDSEIDQYPLGKARNNCTKEYLQKMDTEIKEYLKKNRPIIRAACEEIIRIYSDPSDPTDE